MYNLVLPYHCNIMLKYLPSQLVEAYMNSYPRACLTLSPDSIILSILLSRFSNGGFFDHILCGCEPQNSAMRCGCDPQKVRGSQPQAYCFRTTFSPLFSFFPKFLINTACGQVCTYPGRARANVLKRVAVSTSSRMQSVVPKGDLGNSCAREW